MIDPRITALLIDGTLTQKTSLPGPDPAIHVLDSIENDVVKKIARTITSRTKTSLLVIAGTRIKQRPTRTFVPGTGHDGPGNLCLNCSKWIAAFAGKTIRDFGTCPSCKNDVEHDDSRKIIHHFPYHTSRTILQLSGF